ncbi:hypothetical protein CJF32_00004436 [Rutstroemia sp. NJR-2017a WRK4]|nr:hypothetical protein CJF32_00004436 [Rutstroemia sp. NJR-2017a WRK4]
MADKFTQNCYAYVNGGVETLDREKGYFPCGTVNSTSDFLTCCYEDDTCVGNNICKASTADLSIETDYYFGYCNDPTYTSSACNTQCQRNGGGTVGIAYNDTLSEWACCSDSTCTTLSDYVFNAPAPSSLLAIATPTSRPYSSFMSSTATASSTTSSTPPTSTVTIIPTEPVPYMSRAAAIGSRVGLVLLIIVIVVAATWIFLCVRKRRKAAKKAKSEVPVAVPEQEQEAPKQSIWVWR